ncbi:hypothetical protein M9434_001369 [Picochlorum sp. BPE23]|nr:hypothetical protein M9434_001369 [Picochlorum sp. BPE23]
MAVSDKQAVERRTMMVARDLMLPGGGGREPVLVNLNDPKTGEKRQFMVTGTHIQECNVVKKKFSSWFVDDSIIQDGSIYIWTPIHIVFLVLPALEKAREQGTFCGIDHIVECLDCGSDAFAVMDIVRAQQKKLQNVCEFKENGGELYYKLNDDKMKAWLQGRVVRLENDLKKKDDAFGSLSDAALHLYSVGMVSEYLSDTWSEALYELYNLDKPAAVPASNVVDDVIVQKEVKKPRVDPKQLQKARALEAKKEAKAKKLAKESAGMKKMSAFFSVKKK